MHVTVVMAVYNGVQTVAAAIESIRWQKYSDWDLLIIDDGSSDGTTEVLESYTAADSRISLIRNNSNLGLPCSLNVGWRAARGELIARMDADDISLPERLRLQVDFMRKNLQVDVLGTGMYLMDDARKIVGSSFRPEFHEDLQERMYRENPFAHPSVMMRRSFLEALGGYDERLRRAQDADLWLRGYRRFRYHNLQEPLIQYRVQPKPTFRSSAYSSFVLFRAAWREGLGLTRGLYSLRPLAAALFIRVGLPLRCPSETSRAVSPRVRKES